MKPKLLLLSFFIVAFKVTHSQASRPLTLKQKPLHHVFYYNGEKISKRKLKPILKETSTEAYFSLKRGITYNVLEITTGTVGGAALGLEGGKWLVTGEFNRPIFIGGAIVVIASILFENKKKNCYYKTVHTYNKAFTEDNARLFPKFGNTASGGIGFYWQIQ